MTREEAILWMQVLKHSKVNWVGEQAEDEDIIARCEEAEEKGYCHRIRPKNVEVVVRCKDCRFYSNDHLCEQLSRFGSIEPLADFYCAFGERREP